MVQVQYDGFADVLRAVIDADNKISLFEWCMERIVTERLARVYGRSSTGAVQYYSLAKLGPQLAPVLSALAGIGHKSVDDARAAFDRGAAGLGAQGMSFITPGPGLFEKTVDALVVLKTVAPKLKRQIIEACAAVVVHDGKVTVREAELLRAMADVLDCPMPPILPGQNVAA